MNTYIDEIENDESKKARLKLNELLESANITLYMLTLTPEKD